jgi:hypothetical protein
MARRSADNAPEDLPEGYTRVVAPDGVSESLVPETILDTLLESGYTKK